MLEKDMCVIVQLGLHFGNVAKYTWIVLGIMNAKKIWNYVLNLCNGNFTKNGQYARMHEPHNFGIQNIIVTKNAREIMNVVYECMSKIF